MIFIPDTSVSNHVQDAYLAVVLPRQMSVLGLQGLQR
jgi:hypothetical protein